MLHVIEKNERRSYLGEFFVIALRKFLRNFHNSVVFWEEDICPSVCAHVGLRAMGGQRKECDRGRRRERTPHLICSAYLPECSVENVLRCALPELRIKVKFLKN